MSSNDKSIRIIKRTDREFLDDREEQEVPVKSENQARREMLNIIRSWIEEQREKKLYRRNLF